MRRLAVELVPGRPWPRVYMERPHKGAAWTTLTDEAGRVTGRYLSDRDDRRNISVAAPTEILGEYSLAVCRLWNLWDVELAEERKTAGAIGEIEEEIAACLDRRADLDARIEHLQRKIADLRAPFEAQADPEKDRDR